MQNMEYANVGLIFYKCTARPRIPYVVVVTLISEIAEFLRARIRVIPPDADWINSARETWRVSRRAAANARGSAPVSVESEVLIALTPCLR